MGREDNSNIMNDWLRLWQCKGMEKGASAQLTYYVKQQSSGGKSKVTVYYEDMRMICRDRKRSS